MAEVGMMCSLDHEVFSGVKQLLENEYGHRTDFIPPDMELERSEISDYDILVPKKSREQVYQNLRKASREGVETLNGFVSSVTADHNVASIHIMEKLGYRVPERVNECRPDLVEKPVSEAQMLEPRKNPDRIRKDCIAEDYIPGTGTDYKIYIIDTGYDTSVSGVVTDSKLEGSKGAREPFETSEIGFETDDAETVLENFFEADFLGIDFIENEGDFYAVDINSAPSFRGVEEAEEELALAIHNRTDGL